MKSLTFSINFRLKDNVVWICCQWSKVVIETLHSLNTKLTIKGLFANYFDANDGIAFEIFSTIFISFRWLFVTVPIYVTKLWGEYVIKGIIHRETTRVAWLESAVSTKNNADLLKTLCLFTVSVCRKIKSPNLTLKC